MIVSEMMDPMYIAEDWNRKKIIWFLKVFCSVANEYRIGARQNKSRLKG